MQSAQTYFDCITLEAQLIAVSDQCDQIWRFIGLWATFKAFGYN